MKFRYILLAFAIGILMFFVAFYGINILFPKPSYDTFCGDVYAKEIVETSTQCEALGGRWFPQNIECIKAPCPQGYCDVTYTCNKEFEEAMNYRARNVFFIALPLGIIIVAVGAFIFGLEAVGTGIIGGGLATLIYGSGAYWPYSENWIRFVISLLGLVILIWLTYYFTRKAEKKRK